MEVLTAGPAYQLPFMFALITAASDAQSLRVGHLAPLPESPTPSVQ
jgi:hypothetical protein